MFMFEYFQNNSVPRLPLKLIPITNVIVDTHHNTSKHKTQRIYFKTQNLCDMQYLAYAESCLLICFWHQYSNGCLLSSLLWHEQTS